MNILSINDPKIEVYVVKEFLNYLFLYYFLSDVYIGVYKIVFILGVVCLELFKDINTVQEKIISIKKDSLANILLKNSHLTEIQLETLLIDILTDDLANKKVGYDTKAKIRTNNKISRGSFNRTLNQAKRNMIYSIYTILLLGYIGILDTPTLSSFIEASNKLKDYMESYSAAWKELKINPFDKISFDYVSIMKKSLEDSLIGLSGLKSYNKKL